MSHRHVICLVVDGLRASALGTYGNTLFSTPALDAVASQSLVADWCFANSLGLKDYYRSVWTGLHTLRPHDDSEHATLLNRLHESNTRQWLVTDDPWLAERTTDLPVDEALLFENEADHPAESMEATCLGRYFAEAVENLAQWRENVADANSLAWLHCRGLHGPWDAPTALREGMLDDEDPTVPGFIAPPKAINDVDDPDLLLSYRTAYAAQVKVLDACIGAFVDAIQEVFSGEETRIVLTSPRGFALGEHGSVGTDCRKLYSESLHVPLLLYSNQNSQPLPRHPTFAQPTDIFATLADWLLHDAVDDRNDIAQKDGISLGCPTSPNLEIARHMVVAGQEMADQAIVTRAWMLRRTTTEDDVAPQLFAKPDDRWECNDVAALCPEIVTKLTSELDSFVESCGAGTELPLQPREESLTQSSR